MVKGETSPIDSNIISTLLESAVNLRREALVLRTSTSHSLGATSDQGLSGFHFCLVFFV